MVLLGSGIIGMVYKDRLIGDWRYYSGSRGWFC